MARRGDADQKADAIGEPDVEMEQPPPDSAAPSAASASAAGPESASRSGNPWSLLSMARRLLAEGKPTLALQAVLAAVRDEHGDHAVLHTLTRVQEQYRLKLQANSTVDDLASLFAQCAIAEAAPATGPALPPAVLNNQPVPLGANNASILAETGRRQIILDAFADGSSFICLQCGGLVSSSRRDEHYAYWCG